MTRKAPPTDPDLMAEIEEELELFVEAQALVWDDVRDELASGRKRTAWMWFVFPVLDGAEPSGDGGADNPAAVLFALDGPDEARAFLSHEVLGPRLREATEMMLAHGDGPPEAVLGRADAMKLHACMTLFARAAPDEPVFAKAMETFWAGQGHGRTVQLLSEG